MDPAAFTQTKPGQLIRVGKGELGYWAFVPDPLPPEIVWTAELVQRLSAADRAIGELAGVGQNLPNPRLLMGLFRRREAVLSSRIEGTQASLSDLLLFEAAPRADAEPEDVREVHNYVRALEHGLSRLGTLPLSLRLIRELHELLLDGVRGQERTPGEFRRSQNWIGRPGWGLRDATYVPPPADALMPALHVFEKYLHAPSDLPPLVRSALVHYQFESLHPFLDGNGRVGRLLISLLLCIEGVLPGPLLYLSAFFMRHREEYYRRLLAVSREGLWNDWIAFFLRGVAEEATDAVGRGRKLRELRETFRDRLQGARAPASCLRLADELFARPAITIPQAADVLGMTSRAAGQNVQKLVAAGILHEATGRARNRVYVAEEIARALE